MTAPSQRRGAEARRAGTATRPHRSAPHTARSASSPPSHTAFRCVLFTNRFTSTVALSRSSHAGSRFAAAATSVVCIRRWLAKQDHFACTPWLRQVTHLPQCGEGVIPISLPPLAQFYEPLIEPVRG